MSSLLVLSACDLLQDEPVGELPPLERASAAERLGLPSVEGEWRLVGYSLPTVDTIGAIPQLAEPGLLRITTQRLDSIAGSYGADSAAYPLWGEVRRDGVVALASSQPAGGGTFIAGRMRHDTLWIELTNLPVAQLWPPNTRVALMRTAEARPFFRFADGNVLRAPPPVDSAALLAAADSAAAAAAATGGDSATGGTPPPRAVPPSRPTDVGGEPIRRPTLERDTTVPPDSAQEPPAARRDTARPPPPDTAPDTIPPDTLPPGRDREASG